MRLRRLAIGAIGALMVAVVVVRARRRAMFVATTTPMEIASGIFCLGPWGRTQTNAYLVRAAASVVLVDAGWAQDAARIQAAVRTVLGPDMVPSAILLTHVHPDHAGAARALAEAWRCPVLIHPDESPVALGDFDAMRRDAGPLDRWVILPMMRAIGARRRRAVLDAGSLAGLIEELEPDGAIPGVDGWTWLATPGHTRGHVAFVRTSDRVVLTGDALVTLRVNDPGGLVGRQGLAGPPWYTTWDRRAAIASITRISALEPTVIAGGHGRPMTGPATSMAVQAFAARVLR